MDAQTIRPKVINNLSPVNKEALNDDPIFRPRRFSDPVSPLNEDIHDETRLLLSAIALVDKLGLKIISIDADRSRNKRILVGYSHECDALDGVEVARHNGASHWAATRHGVEIRWVIPMEAA